jgi:hypothetical protein
VAQNPQVRGLVLALLGAQRAPTGVQVVDEAGLGLRDGPAGVAAGARVERAVGPDRVDDRQAEARAEAQVVLGERHVVATSPVPSRAVTNAASSTLWPRSPNALAGT